MRDRIKYTAAAAAVFIILAALFLPTAEKKSDGKIHIRYWYVTGAKEVVPYHVSKFNASQDSIVVEPTALPWNEHEKKVLTAILSENPPDVINLVTPVAKWASRMALVSLDELIKRDSFSDTIFFPSLWKEMIWQNKVFAVPLYSNSYAFFYNKKLFRQAGLDPEKPPRTWDEVKEYSRKLTKRDIKGNYTQVGFIPNYGNLQTSVIMAWQMGAKFLSPDGKQVKLNCKPMADALDWEVKYFDEYPLNKISSFMAGFGYADQHGFLSGKVAMMVLDNTFLDQIKLYTPNLDYGVSVIPSFEGYPTASSAGSWWVAIPRGSKKAEAAWEFIKFAVREDIQIAEANSDEALLFPANRMAANNPAFIKGRNSMQVLVKMMDYAHSPSIAPLVHDIFWREFTGAHERAIHKKQTPERALMQGDAVIQKQLDMAIEYDEYVRSKMKFQTVSAK
jgi:ABC-type glycerol-3-phosphate transport system substrate-binding protein